MPNEINFLHSNFKTKVTCSCIAEDDYQPENLISSDFWSQDRGFIAYNVVKPPVTLTFTFRHPVEVHRVKLWPVSGSQRSTGFDIQIDTKDDFLTVAKCMRTSANIVEFTQSTENNSPTSSACQQLRFFSSNFIRRSLKHVSSVRVIITATQRCAAVLRKLEIWGVPSGKVSPSMQEASKLLWCKATSSMPLSDRQIEAPSTSDMAKPSLDDDLIPEEYLDSITCDLMLFPMRLPCGKAVDQSTIEKHSQIEEKWGRAPSDPFTGKLFTANSKPVLDATLKSSIDRFLLQNANRQDVKKLPRTVGRKSKAEDARPSNNISATYAESFKRLKSDDAGQSAKLSLSVIPLDEAMKSALNAIRQRSTAHENHPSEKDKEKLCVSCKSKNHLYKIKTCDHLVCRNCLNKIKTSLICTCGKLFQSSDVERFFQ